MDTEELEMSSREKQQLEDERSKTPHDEVKGETLRAVICVCRHGDRYLYDGRMKYRTPKQKLKFKVMSDSLLRKLEGIMKNPRKELKVKEASQLSHIVSVVTDQIHEMKAVPLEVETDGDDEADQDANRVLKTKLLQLVAVYNKEVSSAVLIERFRFVHCHGRKYHVWILSLQVKEEVMVMDQYQHVIYWKIKLIAPLMRMRSVLVGRSLH